MVSSVILFIKQDTILCPRGLELPINSVPLSCTNPSSLKPFDFSLPAYDGDVFLQPFHVTGPITEDVTGPHELCLQRQLPPFK